MSICLPIITPFINQFRLFENVSSQLPNNILLWPNPDRIFGILIIPLRRKLKIDCLLPHTLYIHYWHSFDLIFLTALPTDYSSLFQLCSARSCFGRYSTWNLLISESTLIHSRFTISDALVSIVQYSYVLLKDGGVSVTFIFELIRATVDSFSKGAYVVLLGQHCVVHELPKTKLPRSNLLVLPPLGQHGPVP